MENVTLNQREQTRLQILNSLLAEYISVDQAATLMGVSTRHTWRLLAAYRKNGAAALAPGHRGRRAPNTIPESTRAEAVASCSNPLFGRQSYSSQRTAERTRGYRNRSPSSKSATSLLLMIDVHTEPPLKEDGTYCTEPPFSLAAAKVRDRGAGASRFTL